MNAMLSLIATVDNASPPVGDNIEEAGLTKRKVMGTVQTLGAAEGKGENARPFLFVTVVEAARHRVVGLDKDANGRDDASIIFERYSKAMAESLAIGWVPMPSAKQQESKLRTAVKLGQLTHVNGVEICNRTVDAQKRQRQINEGKNDFSPFDGLVKVARAQISSPDTPLTDEQIDVLLTKQAGDTPEEADRIEKVMKQVTALSDAKENPVSPESKEALIEAAAVLMKRIRELGGSSSMRKQAEKIEAKQQAAKQNLAMLVERSRTIKAAMTAAN